MVIGFFVAVPSLDSGLKVAELASAAGYKTNVEQDDDSQQWTCYCSKRMLANYEGVIAAQEELATLSAPFQGVTDGWGTFGNEVP